MWLHQQKFLQNGVGSAFMMTWIFLPNGKWKFAEAEEMDRSSAAFWAKVGQGKHAIRIRRRESGECEDKFRD